MQLKVSRMYVCVVSYNYFTAVSSKATVNMTVIVTVTIERNGQQTV